MENIENLENQKEGKGLQNKNIEGKKKITEDDVNKLLFKVLFKNKLFEKLNLPAPSEFKAKINEENREERIKAQVKKICDFGLISEGLGELICQKLGVAQNNSPKTFEKIESAKMPENKAFLPLEGEIKEFFEKRNDVLEYLKNCDFNFELSDLEKIANVVKKLEARAKEEYMKELYNNKIKAISAPYSLAGNFSGTDLEAEKTISAKDIAQMSTEEFLKNEKLINKLLSKRQIKGL